MMMKTKRSNRSEVRKAICGEVVEFGVRLFAVVSQKSESRK